MGAAWGAAVNFALKLNQKSDTPFLNPKLYILGVFLLYWVGAKLFYLMTADFSGKADGGASSSSFWLGGGFVFYGGLIFGLLFSLFFAVKTKQGLKRFNIFLPALALGHGIGRLGCLLAGCCYGSKTDSPLSIKLWGAHRHPTQIYEALFLFGLAFIFSKKPLLRSKNAVWWYFLAYAGFRFLIEFIRGDHIRGIYAAWAFDLSDYSDRIKPLRFVCVARRPQALLPLLSCGKEFH